MDTRNYVITHHVRERFVERFSADSKQFSHLSAKCNGCSLCRDLTFQLHETVTKSTVSWDRIIQDKIRESKEVKIFNNDARFMDYMYTKYGFHRYHFMINGIILFIILEFEGKNIVLTCVDANNPVNCSNVIANFIKRPKYKKKKTTTAELVSISS